VDSDAELVEVNPLALTADNQLIALDAKMIIDENALYRQPMLRQLQVSDAEHPDEQQAREAGLSYIKLDGQIGCVFNGAGIGMAIMDLIHMYGGEFIRPANFLDVGGSAPPQAWQTGLQIVFRDPDVKCVLVNVFGGSTRCDYVARALVEVCRQHNNNIPIIVRLRGTNASQAMRMLSDAGLPDIHFTDSLSDTVISTIRLFTES
jgi:succinyl-CoA synthetase beta subunit